MPDLECLGHEKHVRIAVRVGAQVPKRVEPRPGNDREQPRIEAGLVGVADLWVHSTEEVDGAQRVLPLGGFHHDIVIPYGEPRTVGTPRQRVVVAMQIGIAQVREYLRDEGWSEVVACRADCRAALLVVVIDAKNYFEARRVGSGRNQLLDG